MTVGRFVLHLAVSWERYWWETTGTFRARAHAIEPVWGDDLEQRYRRFAAAFRRGIVVRDAVARAREMLTPEERQALEICGLGHGIGITPEEPPSLSGGGNDVLQPGMCLVIRAAMRACGRARHPRRVDDPVTDAAVARSCRTHGAAGVSGRES